MMRTQPLMARNFLALTVRFRVVPIVPSTGTYSSIVTSDYRELSEAPTIWDGGRRRQCITTRVPEVRTWICFRGMPICPAPASFWWVRYHHHARFSSFGVRIRPRSTVNTRCTRYGLHYRVQCHNFVRCRKHHQPTGVIHGHLSCPPTPEVQKCCTLRGTGVTTHGCVCVFMCVCVCVSQGPAALHTAAPEVGV